MKKDKVKIRFQMVKRSGKIDEGSIDLQLPDTVVYRILKKSTTKEELLVYCLVDILAKLQGYSAGHYLNMEVEEP